MNRRPRATTLLLGVMLSLVVAAPVAAADASAKPVPPGQAKEKPNKGPKGPEVSVTVSGTVAATTDGKGRPDYSLTVSGTTWSLSAGPKWFWGTGSPLAEYVGDSVSIVGTHREGSTDLDVGTVDGTAIRDPGRPAWAGGPSWAGQKHPGWKAWKGIKPGRGLGREGAPGQNKDKNAPGQNKASAAPGD
jgi:hypothetical protein